MNPILALFLGKRAEFFRADDSPILLVRYHAQWLDRWQTF